MILLTFTFIFYLYSNDDFINIYLYSLFYMFIDNNIINILFYSLFLYIFQQWFY
jgi:hypothetical protein